MLTRQCLGLPSVVVRGIGTGTARQVLPMRGEIERLVVTFELAYPYLQLPAAYWQELLRINPSRRGACGASRGDIAIGSIRVAGSERMLTPEPVSSALFSVFAVNPGLALGRVNPGEAVEIDFVNPTLATARINSAIFLRSPDGPM